MAATGAATAAADGPGKVESTVLYSFLRSDAPGGDGSFHGHRTDLTWFESRRFGIGATLINSQAHNADLLFGPEFPVIQRGRIGLRAQVRAGGIRRLLSDERGVQFHRWSFATATSGSLDVTMTEGWTWRIQPEVVWWSGNRRRNDFRISTGVVLGWGTAR